MIKNILEFLLTLAVVFLLVWGFPRCGKEVPAPISLAPDIIDTTILDSKVSFDRLVTYPAFADSTNRSATDGYFDVIFLGDWYKGKNGLDLFLFDAGLGRNALLSMFTSFDTTCYIDTSKIRFHFRNVKQNLSCDDNTGFNEGVSCSTSKILSAAGDVANGLFTIDHIAVFMNGKGHGGSDGALISVTGFGSHTTVTSICPSFYQGAIGKFQHEFLHTYCGMAHVLLPDNKLGSCVNGCCFILAAPVLLQHQVIFAGRFNSIVN